MINFFINLNPVIQALIATIFTWLVTLLGASLVFIFKSVNKNLMDGMLGFAAGIMIAASFFSLLSPAISMAENLNMTVWLITFLGFFSGGLLLFIGDKIFEKVYTKGNNSSIKRIIMLVLSITLHNIPEGIITFVSSSKDLYLGVSLSIAILLHNIPEGIGVAVPIYYSTRSKKKAFLYTALAGFSETIGAIISYIFIDSINDYLFAVILSFTAGIMIYLSIFEFIKESRNYEKNI